MANKDEYKPKIKLSWKRVPTTSTTTAAAAAAAILLSKILDLTCCYILLSVFSFLISLYFLSYFRLSRGPTSLPNC